MQATATFAAGLPGVGMELEARRLERAVIDPRGNAAEDGDFFFRQAGFSPSVAQRTGVKFDIHPGGIAPEHFGLEHPPFVGNAA
jgi:hypothetical protein